MCTPFKNSTCILFCKTTHNIVNNQLKNYINLYGSHQVLTPLVVNYWYNNAISAWTLWWEVDIYQVVSITTNAWIDCDWNKYS